MLGFADKGPPYVEALVARARAAIGTGAAVLVGHSGAGPLLPAIGGAGYVVVDGGLPPKRGDAPLAPPELLKHLDPLTTDGRLAPWSQWWGDGAMTHLVPDPTVRNEIEAELPMLPRAYFDERARAPDGWSTSPAGYVQLSPAYAAEAHEARDRGWPVEVLDSGHLHMVVDPDAVADAIVRVEAASHVG